MLLELAAKELDEQLEDAMTIASEAERRLAMQREERRIAGEQAAIAVERATFTAEVAANAHELFRDYGSARATSSIGR